MNPFSETQRKAAVVVGVSYLLGMALFIFSSLVRLGVSGQILTLAIDIARVIALYGILAPFHRLHARFAAMVCLAGIAVQGLAGVGSHSPWHRVEYVLMGVGSAVFAWLWVKSAYIPRSLAFLGLAASTLLALGNLEIILLPILRSLFGPWFMAPMFFFEIGMGVWLLGASITRHPAEQQADAWISTGGR